MILEELEAAGAFVSDALEKKEITWVRNDKEGKSISSTFHVYIRPQAFGTLESVHKGEFDSRMALYVSRSILDEHGNPSIPYEKAVVLNPALGTLLLTAINEVNGIGASAKN